MNDLYYRQGRIDDRIQAQADFKSRMIDDHGKQLRDQVQYDQMNKMALRNAEKMSDVNDADRQKNYNSMMLLKEQDMKKMNIANYKLDLDN